MIPTYGINGGNIPMEAAIPQYNHVRFNGIPHLDDG